MKLNDANPQQHLAIICLAGVFLFLNMMPLFKSKGDDKAEGPQQKYANSFDPMSGQLVARETKFQNPKIGWWESLFCRGYKRSSFCSFKLLHPFGEESEELGVDLPEGEPEKDHVVYFRGSLGNSMSDGKIQAPLGDEPAPRIEE